MFAFIPNSEFFPLIFFFLVFSFIIIFFFFTTRFHRWMHRDQLFDYTHRQILKEIQLAVWHLRFEMTYILQQYPQKFCWKPDQCCFVWYVKISPHPSNNTSYIICIILLAVSSSSFSMRTQWFNPTNFCNRCLGSRC